MQDWNSEKPFGYLHTTGLTDLESAYSFLSSRGSLRSEVAASRGDSLDIARFSDPKSLESMTAEKRLGIALAVCDDNSLLKCLPDESVHLLVFCDDDQIVRGLMLNAIESAFRKNELREDVGKLCYSVLEQHYRIGDRAIAERLTVEWISTLSDLIESIRGNARLHEKQRKEPSGLESDALAARFAELSSSDPIVVRRALRCFTDDTTPPAGFLEKCKDLLREATDVDVRILAIRKLARSAKQNDRAEINVVLTKIVCDESQSLELRDVAYSALHEINALPVDTWPEVRRAVAVFRFPEDVDWTLVDRLGRTGLE